MKIKICGMILGVAIAFGALATCPNREATNIEQTCSPYVYFGYHCDDRAECTKTVWDNDILCKSSRGNDCIDDLEGGPNGLNWVIANGIRYNGQCGMGSASDPDVYDLHQCRCRHLEATGVHVGGGEYIVKITVPCAEE